MEYLNHIVARIILIARKLIKLGQMKTKKKTKKIYLIQMKMLFFRTLKRVEDASATSTTTTSYIIQIKRIYIHIQV